MSCTFSLPVKQFKSSIRQVNLDNLVIGGEKSLPFMYSENNSNIKPLTAIEILTNIPANYPEILKQAWKNCINDSVKWAKEAVNKGADVLVVRFNINNCENAEIAKSIDILNQIVDVVDIPVIILGTNKREIDIKLLPELAKSAGKSCTIGIVEEESYKEIIPSLIDYNHNVIARTPIDINLAKELNILISEKGFDPDRILIDPNMGALGYGLDYAYSVIERIKLAGLNGDNMLNMPIITFVGEESWKAKEAKSQNFPDGWGELSERSFIWECVTAASMLVAGANLVVFIILNQ